MNQNNRIGAGIAAAFCMLILILDARTAISGARAGLEICYKTVIPSLFPFIVISIVINANLTGIRIRLLRPIGKLCGMPAGSESLLLLGLLGGYPVGAQSIYNAYHNKSICKQDARRLLGFCNNAGPAFIFGMIGSLFHRSASSWALWGIHILSAIIVGCVLPQRSHCSCNMSQQESPTIPQTLDKGIKTICRICGWIVLFRILIAFLQKWVLWCLPVTLQICLISILELANGCCEMFAVVNPGFRFILCSGILAFGGACVLMQTRSVTAELGWGMYFPGKILQTVISVLLAYVAQRFLFPTADQYRIHVEIYGILILCGIVIITILPVRKKVVAFLRWLMYNNKKILPC